MSITEKEGKNDKNSLKIEIFAKLQSAFNASFGIFTLILLSLVISLNSVMPCMAS